MSELIGKVRGLLKRSHKDSLDAYLEKSARNRERELMKERKAVAAFEKKLSNLRAPRWFVLPAKFDQLAQFGN